MIEYYKLQSGLVSVASNVDAQIIVLVSPEQEEINYLIREHKLDEHNLLSAFDSDELARLEYEDDHFAIIYKRPKNYSAKEHFQFRVASSGIFLFEDLVIIISDIELKFFAEKKLSRLTSLKIFVLKLINLSIVHFNEHLRIINKMSDNLEQRLIYNTARDEYLTAFGLNKSLVYYINAIASNEALLKKLQMSKSLNFTEPEQELLDDIIIENLQCRQQAEIYLNVLSGMLVAHEGMVANRMNTLVKTLNVITVGIMVPTFVVSTFSMNVQYPFQTNSPYAFWAICLMVILSTIAFLLFQHKKKW